MPIFSSSLDDRNNRKISINLSVPVLFVNNSLKIIRIYIVASIFIYYFNQVSTPQVSLTTTTCRQPNHSQLFNQSLHRKIS